MKILYIDPAVRSATSAKYRYYDGVFDQLVKMHDVRLFQGVATDINQILDRTDFNPDAIIFGIGWFGKAKYFGKIENLNVPTICFLYKPQNDLEQKLNFCRINDIDLIVTPIPTYYEFEKATGVKTALFPFGFDPEFFHPRAEISKEYGEKKEGPDKLSGPSFLYALCGCWCCFFVLLFKQIFQRSIIFSIILRNICFRMQQCIYLTQAECSSLLECLCKLCKLFFVFLKQ